MCEGTIPLSDSDSGVCDSPGCVGVLRRCGVCGRSLCSVAIAEMRRPDAPPHAAAKRAHTPTPHTAAGDSAEDLKHAQWVVQVGRWLPTGRSVLRILPPVSSDDRGC